MLQCVEMPEALGRVTVSNETKWIRVMADFCSDGLWEKNGCAVSSDDLPINEDLKVRLEQWCIWYEKQRTDVSLKEQGFDIEGFAKEGLEIAKEIKKELPEWTVVYFDESKLPTNLGNKQLASAHREHYEYEVK